MGASGTRPIALLSRRTSFAWEMTFGGLISPKQTSYTSRAIKSIVPGSTTHRYDILLPGIRGKQAESLRSGQVVDNKKRVERKAVIRRNLVVHSPEAPLGAARSKAAWRHIRRLSSASFRDQVLLRSSALKEWLPKTVQHLSRSQWFNAYDRHKSGLAEGRSADSHGVLVISAPSGRRPPPRGMKPYPSNSSLSFVQTDGVKRGDEPTSFPGRLGPALEEGVIYLEAAELGRWLQDYLSEQIIRPQPGIIAVDPRLTPSWGGPSLGF
jgi:hypothetical protein